MSEKRFHAGIVLAPQQRYSGGEELRRLMRLISTVSAEEMRNRIEFLSAWSMNGKAANSSGQYYIVQEYHLVLCDGHMPDLLNATRFVDLHADLM